MEYPNIFELIEKYQKIVIFGHINPDGDCYGSQLGLRNVLRLKYPEKEIYAVGSGFSRMLNYLGELDKVSDDFIEEALGIVVDVGQIARIEDNRVTKAKELIKIDHHLNQDDIATIEIVDNSKVACAEIITKLIVDYDLPLNKEVALPLYLGFTTDSGRFLYQPLTEETFNLIGRLFSTGIDVSTLYDTLYEVDEKMLKFRGYILLNYKKTKANIAYLVLTKETLKEFDVDYNLAASLVNTIAGIKDVPAWVFFSEADNGSVRVELRSKTIDVQKVAIKFGGGGHLHASGCKLDTIEDYKYVLEALDRSAND